MNPAQTCTRKSNLSASFGALLSVFLLAAPWSACGQGFSVTDVRIGPDGHVVLTHAADTNSYYILLHGNQVTAILTAKDMQLGKVGTNQLRDPTLATTSAFYRVQQVPLASPLDTDGDGIDDVYELKYRPLLDPLSASDAGLDPDGDGRTTLEEYRAGRNPFVADLPEVTTISYPTNATTASFVIFSGVATTNTLIRVEGGAAYVTNAVGAGGAFDVMVALNPNRLNRLFVSAVDEYGNVSAPVPIDILQDSVAPYLFIDFPTNGTRLSTSNTLVAGRVGDALSGFLGLNVTVNGDAANVDVGIGPNGTFQRMPVALILGTNQITVVATDRLGNSITKSVTLIREDPTGPRLLATSGDLQQTNIMRRLAQPLLIKVTQPGGAPIANQLVNFQVTRSDGRLLPVNTNQLAADITTRPDYSTNGTMFLQLFTDANGEARAWWTMGMDAGHANNRVTVTGQGLADTVYFCASATALPAKQINIGSGNNQRGETLGHAPEPLKVWVSDGNNPVAGVPVTFTVVQGGGELVPIVAADGASPAGPGLRGSRPTGSIALAKSRAKSSVSEATVLTSMTGHAEVDFLFGPDAGNQMVEATFAGNAGLPATFTARTLARVPGQPTSFVGLIQDNALQPVGRAYCELMVAGAMQGTYSDAQGRFAFLNIPAGTGHLHVDGNPANTLGTNSIPTNSFPALQFTIAIVPNAENSLPMPVLLPRLNTNNAKWYYGTNDLVVICEGIAGLKMTIKANSMKHPSGELVTPGKPAFVSLNQVHHDDIPMPMPDGASPPFAWTLQPGGATFDPPVQVEYPNMSGLAPGAAAFFLTFNHDTERFEIVASGHVVEDGSKIVCDPGAGLTISGWGCNCPPYSVAGNCSCTTDPVVQAQLAALRRQVDAANADAITHLGNATRIVLQIGVPIAKLGIDGLQISQKFADALNECRNLGCSPQAPLLCAGCIPLFVPPLKDAVSIAQDAFQLSLQLGQALNELGAAESAYADSLVLAGQAIALCPALELQLTKDYLKYQIDRLRNSVLPPLQQALDEIATKAASIEKAIQDYTVCLSNPFNCGGFSPSFPLKGTKSAKGAPVPLEEQQQNIQILIHQLQDSATNAYSANSLLGTEFHTVTEAAKRLNAGLNFESWVLTVNGQSVAANRDGTYFIPNISAPDLLPIYPEFGRSPGDFLSDDFLRLVGSSTRDGVTRYVYSDRFQIRSGQTYSFSQLFFTNAPPVAPESILAVPDNQTLTALGQTTQVRVAARFPGGLTGDVSPKTSWTTYRTSNVRVASVSEDGLVTAIGRGMVFIIAVNDGATSVTQIDVSPGDPLTTISGVIVGTNGLPIAGVRIVLTDLAQSGVTDADGRFVISRVPTGFGRIRLTASFFDAGNLLVGSVNLSPLPGGVVDAGTITLKPPVLPKSILTAGAVHSAALRVDGSLWTWGENVQGQLGDGTSTNRADAVRVGKDTDWVAVSVGKWASSDRGHTLGVKSDGSLWAWGANSFGQLGDGTVSNKFVPVQIGASNDWADVAAGAGFSLAVKADGSLWAWGQISYGLGNGTTNQATTPVRIGLSNDWKTVSAGSSRILALKTDGSLWAGARTTTGR